MKPKGLDRAQFRRADALNIGEAARLESQRAGARDRRPRRLVIPYDIAELAQTLSERNGQSSWGSMIHEKHAAGPNRTARDY